MWLQEKLGRDEEGQAATEYVMVMLGVALFLVFAAFTLNGVVGGPANAIKNWITTVSLPPRSLVGARPQRIEVASDPGRGVVPAQDPRPTNS